jgi:hypothetical protein
VALSCCETFGIGRRRFLPEREERPSNTRGTLFNSTTLHLACCDRFGKLNTLPRKPDPVGRENFQLPGYEPQRGDYKTAQGKRRAESACAALGYTPHPTAEP